LFTKVVKAPREVFNTRKCKKRNRKLLLKKKSFREKLWDGGRGVPSDPLGGGSGGGGREVYEKAWAAKVGEW